MSLGEELRRVRMRAGLSQEDLAFKADISRNYVSLLERDEKSPTVQTLFRICRALGVRASKLMAKAYTLRSDLRILARKRLILRATDPNACAFDPNCEP
jgi:transcriptional regulator with XRE-family HTH domain